MPCSLTPSLTGREDFSAPTGAVVTIRIEAPAGCSARMLHIRYGKDPIDALPPLQFTVDKGRKILVVLVEASKPGALLQLIEVCGSGKEQVVDRFHFDPLNPARGYIVHGGAK
jgi:hypothetical protein